MSPVSEPFRTQSRAAAVGVRRMTGHRVLADLGLGIGWRPEIAGLVAELPGLRFCEVIAESVADGVPPPLAQLRNQGVTVLPHGTRLSLGGTDPLDPARVRRFVAAGAVLDAALVSEHIAFVRAGGHEAGHLLPLPRTREALDVLERNITALRTELDTAGAGADRGAVRLAGGRADRGRLAHRADGTHRHLVAAGRGERLRQRTQPGYRADRAAGPAAAAAGGLRARGGRRGGRDRPLPRHAHRSYTATGTGADRRAGRPAGRRGAAAAAAGARRPFPPAAELYVELDAIARAGGLAPITRSTGTKQAR